MAAAQVAKKLKDRRQKQTLEEIFRKVDRDGSGTILIINSDKIKHQR